MARKARFHTTVTERGSFRDCRRRWYLESQLRLHPKSQIPWPLIFGEAVHTGLEAYYRSSRNETDMLDAFKAAWEAEGEDLKLTYGGFYDLGVGEEWNEHLEKGVAMLTNYNLFDKSHPFFDEIAEVNIESRAFVDILSTSRERLPGLPLLSGRIDLVGYRDGDNAPWIMDHKTAASAPSVRALDIDDQLTGYCYIYWRLTGIVPRGAIYNVLSKEPPHPPRILANGQLSRDKSQRTTFELYLQTIKEQGLDPVEYEDHLNFLSEKGWRQFFVREGVTRNEEELLSFEERLAYEYQDMKRALKDPGYRYPNPGQRTCGICQLIPVCQAVEEQSDAEYVIEEMYESLPPRHSVPEEIQNATWKGV